MVTGKEMIVPTTQEVFALPDIDTLKHGLEQVRRFQAAVKELLIEGHDYGIIPGTDKPTLLKPGAEKIDKILKLADTYDEIEKVEDWVKPFFFYKIKCRLSIMGTEIIISEGMGSCNSMEGKYRYRFVFGSDVPEYIDKSKLPKVVRKSRKTGKEFTMYRIDNEDIYTLANTILKMAKKRAHIDASLSAGRLSDVFTQDIEDIIGNIPPTTEDLIPEATKPPESPIISPPTTEASQPEPGKGKEANKPMVRGEYGEAKPKRDPATITNIEQLARALKEDFGLSYQAQYEELNIKGWHELAIPVNEAYQKVAAVREVKES